MASYNQFPTVNTGDLWTSTNHNIFIKGNWDWVNNHSQVALFVDDGFGPITDTPATGPTKYESGGGLKVVWQAVRFPAGSDTHWEWHYIADRGGTANGATEIWGYMSVNNTGSKDIIMDVYCSAPTIGDNITTKVFPSPDSLTKQVNNSDLLMMLLKIPIVNGDVAGKDHQVNMRIRRNGSAGGDDASGEFRVVAVRNTYTYG